MIVRKESEIFKRLLSYVLSRTNMSDIRETDALVKACAAVASEIAKGDEFAWQRRNEGSPDGTSGELLDDLLETYFPAGITRSDGAYASGGGIVFNRPMGSSGVLTVLAGTKIKRQRDGMFYMTLVDALFGIADLVSSAVPAVCLTKGSKGNSIIVGEITQLAQAVPGVTSCSNTSVISNGADADGDETARQKAKDYVKAISPATPAGIMYRTLNYTSSTNGTVKFAKWRTLDLAKPGFRTIYIDDGNGTSGPMVAQNAGGTESFTAPVAGGKYTLYTRYNPIAIAPAITYNGGAGAPVTTLWANAMGQAQVALPAGSTPTNDLFTFGAYSTYGGLVGEVQKMINGVINDPDDAGIGGAGLVITVEPAQFSAYTTIDANILYTTGANVTLVAAQIKAALVTKINSLWSIGKALTIADITDIVKGITGVDDITDILIDGTAANKYAAEYEVIRVVQSGITLH